MTSVNPRKHGIVRLIGCMGGIIICVNYKSMHVHGIIIYMHSDIILNYHRL
jgi:hypothetical protein